MKKWISLIPGIQYWLLIGMLLSSAGCFAGAYKNPVSAANRKEPAQLKTGDFIKGAQLWANNCSRCHNYRNPKDYNDEYWKPVMFHMRVRAGLTGQETNDILTYIRNSN